MSLPIITKRFATLRGALRLILSYGELAIGMAAQRKPEPGEVRRLVFVCHGNICRSAYAHVLAKRAGAQVASFGLSTATGRGAHAPVVKLAARRGINMTAHRATDIDDFVPKQGDLLLAMETRHLRILAAEPSAGAPAAHAPWQLRPLAGAALARSLRRGRNLPAGLPDAHRTRGPGAAQALPLRFLMPARSASIGRGSRQDHT